MNLKLPWRKKDKTPFICCECSSLPKRKIYPFHNTANPLPRCIWNDIVTWTTVIAMMKKDKTLFNCCERSSLPKRKNYPFHHTTNPLPHCIWNDTITLSIHCILNNIKSQVCVHPFDSKDKKIETCSIDCSSTYVHERRDKIVQANHSFKIYKPKNSKHKNTKEKK